MVPENFRRISFFVKKRTSGDRMAVYLRYFAYFSRIFDNKSTKNLKSAEILRKLDLWFLSLASDHQSRIS